MNLSDATGATDTTRKDFSGVWDDSCGVTDVVVVQRDPIAFDVLTVTKDDVAAIMRKDAFTRLEVR